ncbi:7678_t:CDS:2, partial [Gigaspora rosea]
SVNVINQVNKISENIIVKEAWKDEKRRLAVHGWIFNMENGHLEDLYTSGALSASKFAEENRVIFIKKHVGYTPSFNGSNASYTDGDNTGGFMGGQTDYASGSQDQKPAAERKRSVRHVTIKQLLNAATQHSDSEYLIDGHKIDIVSILGSVRDMNVSSTNVIEFKIDDGTGFIDAKIWFESEEKKESSAAYKISIDSYVCAYGNLKNFKGKNFLNCIPYGLRVIENYNEISCHLCEVVYEHLSLIRSDSGTAFQQSSTINTINTTNYSNNYNNNYVGNSHALSDPLHTEIRDYVVKNGHPQMGLQIASICGALGFQYGSDSKIKDAIETMIAEGILYNTQDDNYVAVCGV